jgi:protein TonB
MKILVFLALVFLFISGCKNEADKQETPTVPNSFNKADYKVDVDKMPAPLGGMAAIQEKVVYPEEAKDKKIEGKVFVLAYIDENGNVVKSEVIKSADPILDSAAVQAVRQVKFTPAKNEGKNVKVQVTIPIVFKLK